MKTLLSVFTLVAGMAFFNKNNQEIYPLCSSYNDGFVSLDTVPKNRQDSSIRLRDDSINKYRRDTFNRKDSFIRKRDSLK